MKDRLVFDTTDANAIASSDSVGAFLRSSDGTLITHTTVGGKEALDVRIAEGINVEVDLDAGDDSVASWTHDGAGNAIGSTGGALHISDAGGSLTVDATDFDIRDLSAAQDNVAISDGTDTLEVNADGSINAVVSATDLDIRDLSASQDNVAISDGTDTLEINADGSINVQTQDVTLANTSAVATAETLDVASTAQDVVASPLADRKYLYIYNNDNRTMFIGGTGVTEASGFPISPAAYMELRAGSSIDIEFVSSKLAHAIRTLELS